MALLAVPARLRTPGGALDSDDNDRDAWQTELAAMDGVRGDPDLDALDRVTREDCKDDVDSLATGLTLSGPRPDAIRVNMKYVCLDQLHKVDDALTSIQGASNSVDEACETSPPL